MKHITLTTDKLTTKIYPTVEEMGAGAAQEAADRICALLEEKEEVNIIFAAAPSQNAFLEALIADKRIDWSRINAFHMDEYIGLAADAPQGFGNFLRARIFDRVPFKQVYYINGGAEDLDAECERYTALLNEHPTDVVCMGIGENGHIAFNDPHVALFDDPKSVKVVSLDEMCRQQQVNDKCFETIEQVPTHALTLTIPTLMRPEWVFCIVPYTGKANAVKATVEGEICEKCPASILRTKEKSCLYLDAASASKLNC
ncbi:MAG: glucosamine-6-phosphate deaminase [Alistipes sp.]|nr:glucosamine-6-phosphate deaminase [Alistipes sp.]